MRPLALLVVAEFLALVLLVVSWLSRPAPAANAAPSTAPAPAAQPDAAPAQAATPSPGPQPTIERQVAAPSLPDVVAGDPVGILVTGSVRDTDGKPVAGANVSLRRGDDYRGGDSGASGAYALVGLQPGEWKLTCRADGYANREADCTLDARAFQQLDIELKASYVVRVRIAGADGASIMDTLQQQTFFGLPYVVAAEAPLSGDLPMTDNSGVSRLGASEWYGYFGFRQQDTEQLRQQGWCGELRLDRPPPLYAALLLRTTLLQTQRIEAGQKELTFTCTVDDVLARFGTLKLRLLDGVSGEPMAGVALRVETAQGGGSSGKTDAEGRAVIERVLPGLGCLELYSTKEHEGLFRYLRVPSGAVLDLGDVTLTAAVKVTGSVRSADGEPANGASVQWTELDSRSFPQPLAYRRSATADAEGRFELGSCGRHRYVVSARLRDGSVGFATVDASNGAPAPVAITLAAPVPVTLRAQFEATAGYSVTVLAADRSPVAVAWLASQYRPGSLALPPGSYTVEIHDLTTCRLVRSSPLQVGSQPQTIEVP